MWVLGLVIMIDQVDQNILRGVIPQLQDEFGIDDFGIGVLASAFVLVNGIVTVPAGYLADRWHRTRMGITGFGLGIAVGGAIGASLGWHWAFIVVGPPGLLIALLAYRLHEPRRGHGDRLHLGIDDDGHADHVDQRLFEGGIARFGRDMVTGLRERPAGDLRHSHAASGPRGGRRPALHRARHRGVAPRVPPPVLGAHPGAGYDRGGTARAGGGHPRTAPRGSHRRPLREPHPGRPGGDPGVLHLDRHRAVHGVVPADAVRGLDRARARGDVHRVARDPRTPSGSGRRRSAHLRGAGFGAFNLVSIVFGAAAALLVVGALADVWKLRLAFLVVSPPVFLGAYVLFRARDHLEADAAKIFEAVLNAMQQEQARETC
jgi:hypothetical protein